jgi:diguanylate cyclase (GGDEF)-like protein/PAS domain S-box-containing protein
MIRRSFGGIRGRLVSLILVGLVPVFVLVILDSLFERRNDINESYEATQRLARLAAAKEGTLIEGAHQLTIALSVLPAVVHRDVAACNSLTRNLLSAYPQYTNFGVVDAGGAVWCSSLPIATDANLGDRPYMRHTLDKKEPTLGGYQIGRLSGLPSIVYASPIVDRSGRSAGATFASLRTAAFGVLGKEADLPDGAVYVVVGPDGKVVQRFPDGPVMQGKDIAELDLFREASGHASGSMETAGVDGVSRLYGFAWSGPDVHRSVLIAIGIPKELVIAAANRHLLLSLVTLLIVAAIAVVAGAVGSQKLILEPILQLVRTTRRIAAHEPNVRSNMRQGNELGELGRAIDEMAGSLEAQQLAFKNSEARFRDLTELSSDWYWEQDEHFRFTEMSSEVAAKAGISAQDHVGKTRWEIPGILLSQAEWDRHIALLEKHEPFDGFTYRRIGPAGELRYFRMSGRPIFDAQGIFQGYRGVGKDATDAKNAEERIQFLAYHDVLTGLPNRASFSMMLNHAIASARRDGRGFAILFIDLDGFKKVNDSFGHQAGDRLLREIAQRLKSSVRQNDTAARLGGDEFAVLLEDISQPQHAALVATKILLQIAAASQESGASYGVTASIGISCYPKDGEDETTLMKNADGSMYRVKQQGRNGVGLHSNA